MVVESSLSTSAAAATTTEKEGGDEAAAPAATASSSSSPLLLLLPDGGNFQTTTDDVDDLLLQQPQQHLQPIYAVEGELVDDTTEEASFAAHSKIPTTEEFHHSIMSSAISYTTNNDSGNGGMTTNNDNVMSYNNTNEEDSSSPLPPPPPLPPLSTGATASSPIASPVMSPLLMSSSSSSHDDDDDDDDVNCTANNNIDNNSSTTAAAATVTHKLDHTRVESKDDSVYDENDDVPTNKSPSHHYERLVSSTSKDDDEDDDTTTTTTMTNSTTTTASRFSSNSSKGGGRGGNKLRHRFGMMKTKKQTQQQQQQQQQQHLGFQKFETEYNTNFLLQDHDHDSHDGYSWGALLPPYDARSGKGSGDDDNNNNNNNDDDSDGTMEHRNHTGGNNNNNNNNNINNNNNNKRRVRFDMNHQSYNIVPSSSSSSNHQYYDDTDADPTIIQLSNERIAKYKNALKIIALLGMAIVCSSLLWFITTTGIFLRVVEEESIITKTNNNNSNNNSNGGKKGVVGVGMVGNKETTQPPYDVGNELYLPSLKPTTTTSIQSTMVIGKPAATKNTTTTSSSLSSSTSPTREECNIIQIEIVTGVLSTTDIVTWTLIQYDTSEIIRQGGPLESGKTYIISGGGEGEEEEEEEEEEENETKKKCIANGRYIFNITNSGGHGFGSSSSSSSSSSTSLEGEGTNTGYYIIYSNETLLGGSDSFFLNEEFSFSVPYYGDELDADGMVHCSNDFFLVFFTDSHPEHNTFELYHEETEQVLVRGGPYHMGPNALYYSRACLPDGVFNLTFFDSAGDGVTYPGHFQIYVEDKFHELEYKIGNSTSMSFVLANHPPPTSKPTIAGCENFLALISTDLDAAHKYYGHAVTWELLDIDTGDVLVQAGPLSLSANLTYRECVPPGRYSFNITNTRGDGLGPKGNYLIFSDTLMIGGSTKFGVNEEMVFSLPYNLDELSGREFDWCAGDFYIKVTTAANPQLLSWKVTNNENGGVFASGGPYRKPFDTYSQWVCLPNGSYTIYIHSLDIVGDKKNKVTVFVESKLLASVTDDDFGLSYTASFDLK